MVSSYKNLPNKLVQTKQPPKKLALNESKSMAMLNQPHITQMIINEEDL